MNEDFISQYYFSGSVNCDCLNNGWSRVTINSLVNYKKDSIWTSNTSTYITYKGIRINFSCGGSAAGFVCHIYIVISNLYKQELHNDYFLVVPINGISINGHIDCRSEEVGYICLIGSNVPLIRYFHCFNEQTTYP